MAGSMGSLKKARMSSLNALLSASGSVARMLGGVVSSKRGTVTSALHVELPPVSKARARKVKLVFVAVSAGVTNRYSKGKLPSLKTFVPSR